jgi:hypothetical protein
MKGPLIALCRSHPTTSLGPGPCELPSLAILGKRHTVTSVPKSQAPSVLVGGFETEPHFHIHRKPIFVAALREGQSIRFERTAEIG